MAYEKTFLITRPRLVNYLQNGGLECTLTKNPYSDRLRAWTVPQNNVTAHIINGWYKQEGIPVPFAVEEFLRGNA